MCNIKDQIVTLLKQRHHSHKVALEQEKDPRSKHAIDLIARIREDSQLIELIDSLPEEKPSEDLEKAAKEYATDTLPFGDETYVDSGAYRDFIAGAEWQKEQMMKDAVEGEIGYWNQRGLSIRLDQSLERLGYDEDTKVKIIIVKKKEE